jgi:hypothetical protein
MARPLRQTDDGKALHASAPVAIERVNEPSARATTRLASANSGRAGGPDFAPIANVSLELFVEISKSLATVNYDLAQGPRLAATHGITPEDWAMALEGWNARMKSNPAVGRQFGALHAAS